MQFLDSFAPLARAYDGFIIDLWGVLHDGVTPYPGAVDALRRLAAAGKPVVLLSNAPRRSEPAMRAMTAMGIPPELYRGLLTSGEVTHRLLRDRDDPFFAALGRRVYHLGPERDANVLAGLDYLRTARPAEADFVLNTGPDDLRSPTDPTAYDPDLEEALAQGLPMLCANPDLVVVRGGQKIICAGTLAQRYQAAGGKVRWVGKPDPTIYGPVLALLGLEKRRVLAVGDALGTDIAGAAGVGIDVCWVLGGIHGHHLASAAEAEAEARAENLAPLAAIPAFRW